MQVDVTLDLADAVNCLRRELAKRLPAGCEVGGITVKSWNAVLMRVEDDMLTLPVRHKVRQECATTFKESEQ